MAAAPDFDVIAYRWSHIDRSFDILRYHPENFAIE
jgi:hypothetical protein